MAGGVVSLITHQGGKKGVSIPSGHLKPRRYIKKVAMTKSRKHED